MLPSLMIIAITATVVVFFFLFDNNLKKVTLSTRSFLCNHKEALVRREKYILNQGLQPGPFRIFFTGQSSVSLQVYKQLLGAVKLNHNCVNA